MIKALISCFTLAFCSATAQQPFAHVKKLIDRNNFAAAERVLDSCMSKKYHVDSIWYYGCLANVKQGKLRSAKKKIKKLQESNPAFTETEYLRGIWRFSSADYAGSINHFTEVLTKNPSHVKARYNRALAFGMLEDFGRAIEDLNDCIAREPRFSDAYYSRAHWREYLGKYSEAAQDYEQTIKFQPTNFDAYLALAFIHHLHQDEKGACEIIRKAIEAGSQAAEEVRYMYCK